MDELSKKLLEKMAKLEYRWTNVKKAHATITAKMSQMGQEMVTKGVYKMADGKSELKYDGFGGAALSQQGWGKDTFDGYWKKDQWKKSFKGATLKAEVTADGHVIHVSGAKDTPFKRVYVDERGLMVRADLEMQQAGQAMKGKFQPSYTKLENGQYLMAGYKIAVQTPMGPFENTTTMTYKNINGVHAVVKSESTGVAAGQQMGSRTIELAWKFNDDVK